MGMLNLATIFFFCAGLGRPEKSVTCEGGLARFAKWL
jgi:hypothetical protein